jgi:hypothetical protein
MEISLLLTPSISLSMDKELPCVNVLSKMDLLQGNTSMGAMWAKNDESDNDNDHGYDNDTSPLPFNLEFFTQCHDLHRLVEYLDSNPMDVMTGSANSSFEYMEDPEYQEAQQRTRSSNFYRKYRKLHNELCDVIEDFGLLSFLPLSIQDAESVGRVVARVDKCNGYVFIKGLDEANNNNSSGSSKNSNMQDMFSSAMVADSEWATGVLADVQEKYLGDKMFPEEIAELGAKSVK